MIISKNILMLKTHSESWSLKRVTRSPIHNIENQYYLQIGKVLKIIGRFKAMIAIIFLLLFQFSLYDFNCDEYFSGLN
ncbi:MAG: hypothetical protein EKK63_18175 [Acinetobacter sp.]|uniref:hypothetical protein n=1 Tax=Acinetobacter sp. TaxID=472 RepID=UPI000FA0F7C1|nr:hypothetical protein [Acinetobacter sp.]RUP36159.1 MAG: hypothetical protein EKK63_18175 [Acinetobacter sp.]